MATKASTPKGINVQGIEKIKTALEAYRQTVQSNIDIGAKKAKIQAAIKGTNSETVVGDAIKELETSVNNLLSFVDKFNNYLTNTLQANYKAQDDKTTMTFTKKQ